MDSVWVFNGDSSTFPAAVFTTQELAETWIADNKLSGCLTKYPLDVSVYDWVIAKGYWEPKKPYQHEPKFKQCFSSAYLEHYHYEEGKEPGEPTDG
jgi:hypothetical protein